MWYIWFLLSVHNVSQKSYSSNDTCGADHDKHKDEANDEPEGLYHRISLGFSCLMITTLPEATLPTIFAGRATD